MGVGFVNALVKPRSSLSSASSRAYSGVISRSRVTVTVGAPELTKTTASSPTDATAADGSTEEDTRG